jgi:hypothetical protein
MSLRVFSFGNNKVEAVESAKISLEKMEREIRQAYKFNNAASPAQDHLFFDTASPTTPLTVPPTAVTQLTFGNDLGAPGAGNGIIECGSPCEYITYKLTNATGTAACAAAPCTLWRDNGPNPGPVVENIAFNGLSFTLLQSDGTAPAAARCKLPERPKAHRLGGRLAHNVKKGRRYEHRHHGSIWPTRSFDRRTGPGSHAGL